MRPPNLDGPASAVGTSQSLASRLDEILRPDRAHGGAGAGVRPSKAGVGALGRSWGPHTTHGAPLLPDAAGHSLDQDPSAPGPTASETLPPPLPADRASLLLRHADLGRGASWQRGAHHPSGRPSSSASASSRGYFGGASGRLPPLPRGGAGGDWPGGAGGATGPGGTSLRLPSPAPLGQTSDPAQRLSSFARSHGPPRAGPVTKPAALGAPDTRAQIGTPGPVGAPLVVAAPETGRPLSTLGDVLDYFLQYGNQARIKIFYLNPCTKPSDLDYDPYRARLVDQTYAAPEHLAVSIQGVVEVHSTGDSEFHSLGDFIRERSVFRLIRRISFFRHYLLRKHLGFWRTAVRWERFRRTRATIADRLMIVKPAFQRATLALLEARQTVACDVQVLVGEYGSEEDILAGARGEAPRAISASDFVKANEIRRNVAVEALKELGERVGRSLEATGDQALAVEAAARDQVEIDRRSLRDDGHASLSQLRAFRERRIKAHKLAAADVALMPNLIKLADLIFCDAAVDTASTSGEALVRLLRSQEWRPASVFRGVFESTAVIRSDPSMTSPPSLSLQPTHDELLLAVRKATHMAVQCVEVLPRVHHIKYLFKFFPRDSPFAPTDEAPGPDAVLPHAVLTNSTRWRRVVADTDAVVDESFARAEREGIAVLASKMDVYGFVERVRTDPSYVDRFTDVDVLSSKMRQIRSWARSIEAVKKMLLCGVLAVDLRTACEAMSAAAASIAGLMLRALKTNTEIAAYSLSKSLSEKLLFLHQRPTHLTEFVAFMDDVADADAERVAVRDKVENVDYMLEVVGTSTAAQSTSSTGTLGGGVPADIVVARSELRKLHEDVCAELEKAQAYVDARRASMLQKQERALRSIDGELLGLVTELTAGASADPDSNAVKMCEELDQMERDVVSLATQMGEVHSQGAKLAPGTVYDDANLEHAARNLQMRRQIWDWRREVQVRRLAWMFEPIEELDLDDIREGFDELTHETAILREQYKGDAVALRLAAEVAEFRELQPLLELAADQSVKQRHWEKVFAAAGQPLPIDHVGTFQLKRETVASLEKLGFGEPRLLAMARNEQMVAGKEEALLSALGRMQNDFASRSLPVVTYQSAAPGGAQVMFKLGSLDTLFVDLDEQVASMQSIKASPFAATFRDEVAKWEAHLLSLQDLLEHWTAAQGRWLYLEPIFKVRDIGVQLPEESTRFLGVDAALQALLAQLMEDPSRPFVPSNESKARNQEITSELLSHLATLEGVHRSLSVYLDAKRLAFPRFYFLADDEMLAILSEVRDPKRVEPHLPKCFEGAAGLRYGGSRRDPTVTSVTSADGEEIVLLAPVRIRQGTGETSSVSVEKWLAGLEDGLQRATKVACARAVADYDEDRRTEWALSWPQMAVLSTASLFWTRRIEDALEGTTSGGYASSPGGHSIDEAVATCHAEVASLVVAVRDAELPPRARLTFSSLVVHDVHKRDVTIALQEANVSAVAAFEWESQLRTYFEQAEPGSRWAELAVARRGSLRQTRRRSMRQTALGLAAFSHVGEKVEASNHGIAGHPAPGPATPGLDFAAGADGGQTPVAGAGMPDAAGATPAGFVLSEVGSPGTPGRASTLEGFGSTMGDSGFLAGSTPQVQPGSGPSAAGAAHGPVGGDADTLLTDGRSIRVRMVGVDVEYGYEYLGPSTRLVVTPLTDRCYRTLLLAYQAGLGGAPQGPAGTGKTETTKDLAKALARHCVVFNCSEALDVASLGRFFRGLLATGAWACFDEFNRIEVEVLSVAAQQIATLQRAVGSDVLSFAFEGVQVPVVRTAWVGVTMNPTYAGRHELPDNLKERFRGVAMMRPDLGAIAEIMLLSDGFSHAAAGARKIVQCLELCRGGLGARDHYDFGMRSAMAVLRTAGSLKLKHPFENEDRLILRALLDVNVPKLVADDVPAFHDAVGDIFPQARPLVSDYSTLRWAVREACITLGLQASPYFTNKCIQLYETVAVRHGLMIVGEPISGKTALHRTLALALGLLAASDQGECPVHAEIVNPKAMSIDALYGSFNATSHEWHEGILSESFRNAATAYPASKDRRWLILDGPVDALWVENLNSLLDDNRKLCLSSGETIRMTPAMTMIFEVADLAHASPATVSRCGMVHADTLSLGWRPMVLSWLERLGDQIIGLNDGHRALILGLVNNHVPVCLEWLRREVGQRALPWSPSVVVVTFMRLFTALSVYMGPSAWWDAEEAEAPRHIEHIFVQALLWSFGSLCADSADRDAFSSFFRALVSGDLRSYKSYSGHRYRDGLESGALPDWRGVLVPAMAQAGQSRDTSLRDASNCEGSPEGGPGAASGAGGGSRRPSYRSNTSEARAMSPSRLLGESSLNTSAFKKETVGDRSRPPVGGVRRSALSIADVVSGPRGSLPPSRAASRRSRVDAEVSEEFPVGYGVGGAGRSSLPVSPRTSQHAIFRDGSRGGSPNSHRAMSRLETRAIRAVGVSDLDADIAARRLQGDESVLEIHRDLSLDADRHVNLIIAQESLHRSHEQSRGGGGGSFVGGLRPSQRGGGGSRSHLADIPAALNTLDEREGEGDDMTSASTLSDVGNDLRSPAGSPRPSQPVAREASFDDNDDDPGLYVPDNVAGTRGGLADDAHNLAPAAVGYRAAEESWLQLLGLPQSLGCKISEETIPSNGDNSATSVYDWVFDPSGLSRAPTANGQTRPPTWRRLAPGVSSYISPAVSPRAPRSPGSAAESGEGLIGTVGSEGSDKDQVTSAALAPPAPAPKPWGELVVPSTTHAYTTALLRLCLQNLQPVLLIGPAGSGKTTYTLDHLRSMDPVTWTVPASTALHARSTARALQASIEAPLERRRRGVLAPPPGRNTVLFVDDLSLPEPETWGSQPPLELLRTLIDLGGLHRARPNDLGFTEVSGVAVAAAMGPSGASGRPAPTARLLRHFCTIALPKPSPDVLKAVFASKLSTALSAAGIPLGSDGLMSAVGPWVRAAVRVLLAFESRFSPTLDKPTYRFCARDVDRLCHGISLPISSMRGAGRGATSAATEATRLLDTAGARARLWAHEALRVFGDRLEDDDVDVARFEIVEAMRAELPATCPPEEALVVAPRDSEATGPAGAALTDAVAGLTWLAARGGDAEGGNGDGIPAGCYVEVPGGVSGATALVDQALASHNALQPRAPLRLAVFHYCVSHVARVARALTLPGEGLLLTGVVGAGRASCARLACQLAGVRLVEPPVGRRVPFDDWRAAVAGALRDAGLKGRPIALLLAQKDFAYAERQLEVASILARGADDLVSLFSAEERAELTVELESSWRSRRASESLARGGVRPAADAHPDKGQLWADFSRQVRLSLTLLLSTASDPKRVGAVLAAYPSIGALAVDRFGPWPDEALDAVARFQIHRSSVRMAPQNTSADLSAGVEASLIEQVAASFVGGSGPRVPARVASESAGPADLETRVVRLCRLIHLDAVNLTGQLIARHGRHAHATPRLFLSLFDTASTLRERSTNLIDGRLSRFQDGLDRLASAGTAVAKLRRELETLKPRLEKATREAEDQSAKLHEDEARTKEAEAAVDVELARANEVAAASDVIRIECEAALAKAVPALEAAIAALDTIDPADMRIVQTYKKPPEAIRVVLQAVMVLLGIQPLQVPDPNEAGKKILDHWTPALKMLGDSKFVDRLRRYDKDHIDPRRVKRVRIDFLGRDEMVPARVETASHAVAGLCRWIIAIVQYDDAAKAVAPRRAALDQAEAEHAALMDVVGDRRKELGVLHARLVDLRRDSARLEKKRAELAAETALSQVKMDRAASLVGGLEHEADRWSRQVSDDRARRRRVEGDTLLCAAALTYLGPMTKDLRDEALARWTTWLDDVGLDWSPAEGRAWSVVPHLGNPVAHLRWVAAGLPGDKLSEENAVMTLAATRTPLLVDPLGQARTWLMRLGSADRPSRRADGYAPTVGARQPLKVMRSDAPRLIDDLKRAVQFGTAVIVTGVGESVDRELDPLLAGRSFVVAGQRFLQLGDEAIELSDSFHLILLCAHANPRFDAALASACCVINFGFTEDGLAAQLARAVLWADLPRLAERGDQVTLERAGIAEGLLVLERRILDAVAVGESILDDSACVDVVTECQNLAGEARRKDAAATIVSSRIDAFAKSILPVSMLGAVLFLCSQDLAALDPMYVFSLDWFRDLFVAAFSNVPPDGAAGQVGSSATRAAAHGVLARRVLDRQASQVIAGADGEPTDGSVADGPVEGATPPSGVMPVNAAEAAADVSEAEENVDAVIAPRRLDAVRRKLLVSVHRAVCHALYSRHHLAFGASVALRLLQSETYCGSDRENMITPEQASFLLTSGRGLPPHPLEGAGNRPGWVAPSTWQSVCRLSAVLPAVAGVPAAILEDPAAWKDAISRLEPSCAGLPPAQGLPAQGLSPFQALALTRALRPDLSLAALRGFVLATLGPECAIVDSLGMVEVLESSTNLRPTVFLLAPGLDPRAELEAAVAAAGMADRLRSVALGRGQGARAEALLAPAARDGDWVLLENAHLAPSWLPSLERYVDRLAAEPDVINGQFRLLVTSAPTAAMPVGLVRAAHKVCLEPQRDLKSLIDRALTRVERLTDLPDLWPRDEVPTSPGVPWFGRVAFALCFLHAVFKARDSYGPLGWCGRYPFPDSDLDLSLRQAARLLAARPPARDHRPAEWRGVPFDALRHLVGRINYGGQVTDARDRALVDRLVEAVLGPHLLAPRPPPLLRRGGACLPPMRHSLDDLRRAVAAVPRDASPLELGLDENADLARDLREAEDVLRCLSAASSAEASSGSVGAGGAARAKRARDEVAARRACGDVRAALEGLEPPFVSLRKQAEEGALGRVLGSEADAARTLLAAMRSGVDRLLDVLDGRAAATAASEAALAALSSGAVPSAWRALAPPTGAPLATFLRTTAARVAGLRRWHGPRGPPSLWTLGRLFSPTAWLSALRQDFARRRRVPLDAVEWRFSFSEDPGGGGGDDDGEGGGGGGVGGGAGAAADLETSVPAPTDGAVVRGLALEGAAWDGRRGCLVEAPLGQLRSRGPAILLRPVDGRAEAGRSPDRRGAGRGPSSGGLGRDRPPRALPTSNVGASLPVGAGAPLGGETGASSVYPCPVYHTADRGEGGSGLASNFVLTVDLPCGHGVNASHWAGRGVALFVDSAGI